MGGEREEGGDRKVQRETVSVRIEEALPSEHTMNCLAEMIR